MVLDTQLPLMAQVANVGPAAQAFGDALYDIRNRESIEAARAIEQEKAIAQNQLLNLKMQGAQQNLAAGQAAAAQASQESDLMQAARINQMIGPMLQGDNTNPPNLTGAYRVLKQQQSALALTDDDLKEFEMAIATPEGLAATRAALEGASSIVAQQQNRGRTASQRERADLMAAAKDAIDPQTGRPKENLTLEQKTALIDLGVLPHATGSAAITTATSPELTEKVAQSEARIAAAEEAATLDVQRDKLPSVKRAVKMAEKDATAKGEAFTELNRLEAGLPALTETVDRLKELAPVATSNISGRLFDRAVKEFGFGATKGSTARVRYQSIINNQLLPLLKETFGAAFTESDRESLQKTMGDVDLAPAEKAAALEEFIAAKQRTIQTKQREVGQEPTQFTSASGITFTVE